MSLYIKADEPQLPPGVPGHPPFPDAKHRALEEAEEVGGARGRMLGKYCTGYRPVEEAIVYSARDIADVCSFHVELPVRDAHVRYSWHGVSSDLQCFEKGVLGLVHCEQKL